jgi:alkylation response protein AidB-like acyl-CoA dehydrogenase
MTKPILALDEDEQALRSAARSFLAAHSPISDLRHLRDDPGSTAGMRPVVWQKMAELDWLGLTVDERDGGSGAGYFQQGILFEELGRALVLSPLLAVAEALPCLDGSCGTPIAPQLASVLAGTTIMCLAHRESSHYTPELVAATARATDSGFVVSGCKQFVAYAGLADKLIVSARLSGQTRDRNGLALFVVDSTARGLEVEPLRLVDSTPRAHVRFDNVEIEAAGLIAQNATAADLLDRCHDVATALQAAEMLGSLSAALELTVAHLKTRVQFGAIIGTFQALAHRAARMFIAQELATSAVRAALRSLDGSNSDGAAVDVSVAKVTVNEAFSLIAREGVQMHGGMGMTDEADIGLYLKRSQTAVALGGDSGYHRRRIARYELSRQSAPA